MATGRKKIIALIISGIITISLCAILGKIVILRTIVNKVKSTVCIDSITHPSYSEWIGDVQKRSKNFQIRTYLWNLTNKDDFLYKGATPIYAEVGPYVYLYGGQKLNVEFKSDRVRYQSAGQIEYDAEKTKELCPSCQEHDKITNINFGYIGLTLISKGDTNLAYSFVPSVTTNLLTMADQGGTRSITLKKIGKKDEQLFPSNQFPKNWQFEFSKFLDIMNKSIVSPVYGKFKQINYTEIEMAALYNVITNATLLGVAAAPPSSCNINPVTQDCLDAGFLFLANAIDVISKSSNTAKNQIIGILIAKITVMLCPDPSTQCLQITLDLIVSISYYVTEHLAQFSMYYLVDSKDYGIVTTKTQKQIINGWAMSELKLPGYPNGIPVPGLITNHTDLTKAKNENTYKEFYKCGVEFKEEKTFAALDDATVTKSSIFPKATGDFLKLEGKHSSGYFGYKRSLDVCKSEQEMEQDNYEIYDTVFHSSYTIRKKSSSEFESVPVHDFEPDSNFYNVNNISVFSKGLVDLSNTKYGLPFLFSPPHFMYSDKMLQDQLKMSPVKKKHGSFYKVEPVTGSVIKMIYRLQVNTVIPESTISAPRLVPLNITYKETTGTTPYYSNPVPLIWFEYNVFAGESDLESLGAISGGITASCVTITVGPIIGSLFIVVAGYLAWKQLKRTNSVTDSANFGKPNPSNT